MGRTRTQEFKRQISREYREDLWGWVNRHPFLPPAIHSTIKEQIYLWRKLNGT